MKAIRTESRLPVLLLSTKFYPPSLPARPVPRSRLVSQLEDGLRLGRRLSLVSAQAGFGKTSLVIEWLASSDHAFTWLSLDEGDNDPVRFFLYLIAALQKIQPDLGDNVVDLLGGPQLPPLESMVTLLVNDLTVVDQLLILVLDDYHSINNTAIHQALQLLLDRLPTSVHLVLITREDPHLALARLRVRGQITEIRSIDLRFTLEESEQFMRSSLGASLPEKFVALLAERTEGWIAGLQLASLSLQGRQDIEEFITAFRGSHHYIIDYLADEVLRRQPAQIREFLIQTAILDRLCADLCNAVVDSHTPGIDLSNSSAILNYLENSNLFLIPLDDTRTWFRYHHLFVDYLITESRPETRKAGHARAAAWYDQHGYPADAIHHYRLAGDMGSVQRLVQAAAPDLIRRGELNTLLTWIDYLPDERVRADPGLSSYKGMILLIGERAQEAEVYAQAASANLKDEAPPSLRGRLASLQAFLATAQGDNAHSLELYKQAAVLLDEEDDTLLSFVLAKLGQAQQQAGNIPAAQATFRRAVAVSRRVGRGLATAVVYSNLAIMTQILGQRREAQAICEQGLNVCRDSKGRLAPIAVLIDVALGTIHYQANQLDDSEACLKRVMEISRQMGLSTIMVGGRNTLSLIQYARGDHLGADASLEETVRLAQQAGAQGIAQAAAGLRADLQLRDGNLQAAAAWLESSHLPLDHLDLQRQSEYFTACRVMVRQKRHREAQQLIDMLRQSDEMHGCNGYLIIDWILQADFYAALGDFVRAVQTLEKAVRLAAQEDYRRPFLDYGADVLPLLVQIRGIAPIFIDQVLSGETQSETAQSLPQSIPPSAPVILAEPLTEREMDVLRLLAQGLTSRQIAERLVVSEGTARWHVNNIIGKLGVHNRTQAVAAARQSGLL
jgi:LuxR family maltose regulon positive regulatory protein